MTDPKKFFRQFRAGVEPVNLPLNTALCQAVTL